MIDLVDNLIDASPSSRADKYDKSTFALQVKQTQAQVSQQQQQADFVTQSMVSSVGILKYDSGNIYEGQLLNGKRSGRGKMTFANGDKYMGMWKVDQMCDTDGIYSFKNGNEYRGSFKTCSKLCNNKFGMFDGQAQLKISGVGTFTGTFTNGLVHGKGKFEFLEGQKIIEKTWTNCLIDDMEKEIIEASKAN